MLPSIRKYESTPGRIVEDVLEDDAGEMEMVIGWCVPGPPTDDASSRLSSVQPCLPRMQGASTSSLKCADMLG